MNVSRGVGLAANQVGLDAQMFVMTNKYGEKFSIINPTVIAASKEVVEGEEGCLSFPGVNLYIKRHHKIKAKWYNELGKEVNELLYGYDARCFLHELDHLNGITYDMHVTPMELQKAKEKAEAQ